ncbi:Kinesin-like protein subito [Dufourea novaeangliae]|uniref:Kinesin-like protein subito n=1 Tax=Dufourea novaeangliae TaxID=178035 RepID=A0A154PBA8_DUFNO|nr:Kinesin-like protein subito [Dufourea novaeangliae]
MYSVWLSIAEIYNDNVYDLLTVCDQERCALKMTTRKDGSTYVKGLKSVHVTTGLEACQLLISAQAKMTVATTEANTTSSRSHTIFVIRLLKYQKENTNNEVKVSTLTFCDVAGSGRFKSNKEDGAALTECRSIKNSLLVFGRCLKSIRYSYSCGDQAVGPFRESKLTRILQKALTGRENISFIITINIGDQFFSDTLGILNNSVIVRKLGSETKDSKRGYVSEATPRCPKSHLLSSIAETPEKTVSFEEYEAVKRRNEELYKEIDALKCERLLKLLETMESDKLNREIEIRDELANHYSKLIEEIEASWKKRAQEIEDENKDLLNKSVNQVKTFYKERIDNIRWNKKRKRCDSGDNEEALTIYDDLKTENALITSKVVVLKEMVRNLKIENEFLNAEKVKCNFELTLIKEELSALRGSMQNHFPRLFLNDQLEKVNFVKLVEELKLMFDDKTKNIEVLKTDLSVTKENNVRLVSDLSRKENELQNTLITLRDFEKKLSVITKHSESLDNQLRLSKKESQTNCSKLGLSSSPFVNNYFCSEDVSTVELTTQAHVDTKLDRYFNLDSNQTTKKMSLNISETDVTLRYSDSSVKEDSGIDSSCRSRRLTSVSDNLIREVKEQYTQTVEDNAGTLETQMEKFKVGYENLKTQYTRDKAYAAELSQREDIIIAMLNTAQPASTLKEGTNNCSTVNTKISSVQAEVKALRTEYFAEFISGIDKMQKEVDDLRSDITENSVKQQEEIERLKLHVVEKQREIDLFRKHRDTMMKRYERLVRHQRIEIDKKREKLSRLEKLFMPHNTRGHSKVVNRKLGKFKFYPLRGILKKDRSSIWMSHSVGGIVNEECLSLNSSCSIDQQLCELCPESQLSNKKETFDASSACKTEESSSTESSLGLNNSKAGVRQAQSEASDWSEVRCRCGIGFKDPGRRGRMSGWMKVRRMNARTELSCQPNKEHDYVNTSDSETDVTEYCTVGVNDHGLI